MTKPLRKGLRKPLVRPEGWDGPRAFDVTGSFGGFDAVRRSMTIRAMQDEIQERILREGPWKKRFESFVGRAA